MSNNIYALLIAINEYHPCAEVPPLYGCINDLNNIKSILTNQYNCPEKNIETLINQQATREAIIKLFQKHLCNNTAIKAGDTVIFFFSGHGSQGRTAKEFEHLNAKKQDETLVCYDSRIPEHKQQHNYRTSQISNSKFQDLADKELAVLLSKVKKGVEAIVIADACHSGSITRGDEDPQKEAFIEKTATKKMIPRALETYLLEEDDFYTKMKTKFLPPPKRYIAFSACKSNQKAVEYNKRGLFTSNFIKILQETKGKISYLALQNRTRLAVEREKNTQSPIIAVPQQFDPNRIFLGTKTTKDLLPFIVQYRHGKWCLNTGAIYGLKPNADNLQLAIYEDLPAVRTKQFVGNTKIEAVKLKETHLKADLFEEKLAEKCPLPSYARTPKDYPTYQAAIISASPNLVVYLNGDALLQQDFLNHVKISAAPFIQFSKIPAEHIQYEIVLQKHQLLIKERTNNKLIYGCNASLHQSVPHMITQLNKLEKWHTIKELQHPQTKLKEPIAIKFKTPREGIKLFIDTNNSIAMKYEGTPIPFEIKIKKLIPQDLYIGILHLCPKFGIETLSECKRFPADQQAWVGLDYETSLTNASDTFKIIISTNEFDDYKFKQKALPVGKIETLKNYRSSLKGEGPAPIVAEEDWCTYSVSTYLERTNIY